MNPVRTNKTRSVISAQLDNGGTTTITVNQEQNGGLWVPLGVYDLSTGTGDLVSASSVTDTRSPRQLFDTCNVTRYITYMIVGFRHKGLQLLYERGNRRRVRQDQVDKIERILARLDASSDAQDMDLPGYRLHPLRGDLVGYWSVTVTGNWRIIFRFSGGHARDVDLIDYH